ncbi:MAG: helix-turn-helix domain-containing protein [Cyanobacteria bacterium J06634_5]
MSIRQILQVWEHDFSHPHQAIMLALADHAHEDGTGMRPSINRIAWKTGYSVRSVQNIMAQLRQLGVLVIAVPATHNTPNEYRFEWAAAKAKLSFDQFVGQKKGGKGRGANSAPPENTASRGAVPVQEGCNSDAGGVQFPCERGVVAVQEGCSPLHPNRKEPSRKPSKETKEETKKAAKEDCFHFGIVVYQQQPDEIDFSELWATNPGLAKTKLRAVAPGHKRLDMVAHGLGHWWVGPGLNDFDEHLIQACRNRKRKCQQPDGVGDAKTFINNMLRNGDWGNFALRCDEAQALKARAAKQVDVPVDKEQHGDRSPFERSELERRDSALGLARFKVAQGDVEGARVLAQQVGLTWAEVTLPDSA